MVINLIITFLYKWNYLNCQFQFSNYEDKPSKVTNLALYCPSVGYRHIQYVRVFFPSAVHRTNATLCYLWSQYCDISVNFMLALNIDL